MFISKVFKLQFGPSFALLAAELRENIRSLIGKDTAGGLSFLIHISLTKSQIATAEDLRFFPSISFEFSQSAFKFLAKCRSGLLSSGSINLESIIMDAVKSVSIKIAMVIRCKNYNFRACKE